MRIIPIDPVANQEFSVTLDGNRWQITLKEARGVMCANVILNNATVLLGQRVVAGTPIIPYEHLQSFGNFLLLTVDDELPYWDRFGIDQQLVYASAAEIAAAPPLPLVWPDMSGTIAVPLSEDLRITESGLVRIATDNQPRIIE
jgi:hypothetical protein